MASYKYPILIQKLNLDTEMYEDYYSTHSNINKVGGKEYTQAGANISNLTFNFKVRYCTKMEDVIFPDDSFHTAHCAIDDGYQAHKHDAQVDVDSCHGSECQ